MMRRLIGLLMFVVAAASLMGQAPPQRYLTPTTSSGPFQWTGGTYTYDPAGNVIGIDQQAFRYDVNGRLVTASVLSPDESPSPNYYSSRGYGYDPYGNMTSKTADGVQTNIAVDSSSNQLSGTGVSYDVAGNLTNLTYAGYQHVYAYDALSSLKSETVTNQSGAPTMYHVYSPSDQRILVADTGANLNTWTIRDPAGNPLRQIENNTSASTWLVRRDYAYREGILLEANVVAESRQEHYTVDHLSTPRLITNASAQVVGYHVYLPFGEEWFPPSSSTQEGSPKKFTGHERDRNLSGYATDPFTLDYMHSRFYSANVGRFLSADEAPATDATVSSPQRWNRYSYVVNRPLNATDPTGQRDAYLYTAKYDVEPGYAVILRDRKTKKIKHVVVVGGFVYVPGLPFPDAMIYQNVPSADAKRTKGGVLIDKGKHQPQLTDSNAKTGPWNADEVEVAKVIPNFNILIPGAIETYFDANQLAQHVQEIGPVWYDNQANGALGMRCDCEGYADQLLISLHGSFVPRTFWEFVLGQAYDWGDWEKEAQK